MSEKELEYEIIPSLLPVENDIEKYVKIVEPYVKRVHFDIMDGIFVEKKAFSVDKVEQTITDLKKAVHLMTVKPRDDIPDYALAGADIIIFHIESEGDPNETIGLIKKESAKVGIALNPGTPAEKVFPYLPKLDLVLVMTVEPGKSGQSLIPETLDKVKELRKKINELDKNIDIAVDGGINKNTIKKAKEAGANLFVCGSAIFGEKGEKDPAKAIDELKKALNY